MANWRIDYDILDRTVEEKGSVSRNARFVSAKWRRGDLAERDVVIFPIQRTVPAGEQKRYKKFCVPLKSRTGQSGARAG